MPRWVVDPKTATGYWEIENVDPLHGDGPVRSDAEREETFRVGVLNALRAIADDIQGVASELQELRELSSQQRKDVM